MERATTWEGRPYGPLVLLFPSFFPAAFTRQRFLDTLLFARLQVKGVTLDLLDDVFLLHFALETAQGIFEGLSLLDSYFSQLTNTPKLVRYGRDSYCKVPGLSQVIYVQLTFMECGFSVAKLRQLLEKAGFRAVSILAAAVAVGRLARNS